MSTVKNREVNVCWSGLVSPGDLPPNDLIAEFSGSNGLIYRIGYESKRSVRVVNNQNNVEGMPKFTEVSCLLRKSALGKPMFTCSFVDKDGKTKSFTASNPSRCTLKVLSTLGQTRRWSGNEFFGFRRNDVVDAIDIYDRSKNGENANTDENDQNGVQSITDSFSGTLLEDITPNIGHAKCKISWIGVKTYGTVIESEEYKLKVGNKVIRIQPGYISIREVTDVNNTKHQVYCEVLQGEVGPQYKCYTQDSKFESISHKPTVAMKEIFSKLNIKSNRNWSGFEFFGFSNSNVLAMITHKLTITDEGTVDNENETQSTKRKRVDANLYPELCNVASIQARNAGQTSLLLNKKSQVARNQTIHEAVKLASQDDVKSFVTYLCDHYPEVVEDGIEESEEFTASIIKKLKVSRKPVDVAMEQAAEILLGKCNMSERSYIRLRSILKDGNIKLPKYDETVAYCKGLDVGKIVCSCGICEGCMYAETSLGETLQFIASSKLFEFFEFPNLERQIKLASYLKSKDPETYKNFDFNKRTIFLRQTGDNFRACARMPTEQISFSVLNARSMINNPYGQFINCLWRGSENGNGLEIHIKNHLNDLDGFASTGIDLEINGVQEHFNLVFFLVTDIGLLEKLLGKCSSISMYGCFWCDKPSDDWDSLENDDSAEDAKNMTKAKAKNKQKVSKTKQKEKKPVAKQTVKEMISNGEKAIKVLGKDPDHKTSAFTKFQQSHKGQYAPPMLKNFVVETMCPCSLHCILAHHRYLWKFMFMVISYRGQEKLIPSGLRTIGCGYLAYQYECYLKSKNKEYDGSSTLKMIGSDCKILEDNIDKFLETFMTKNESRQSKSFEKMRQVSSLYHQFKDLAVDMRSKTANKIRAESFAKRAKEFFVKLKSWAGGASTSKLPYLHIMIDHIGQIMEDWCEILDWGYGYFSCTAGEHLNKIIKTKEIHETNLSENRFKDIIHDMRIKQFYYPMSVYKQFKEITCSRCHEKGHNKKNKSCRLHPSQPTETFELSDSENN